MAESTLCCVKGMFLRHPHHDPGAGSPTCGHKQQVSSFMLRQVTPLLWLNVCVPQNAYAETYLPV